MWQDTIIKTNVEIFALDKIPMGETVNITGFYLGVDSKSVNIHRFGIRGENDCAVVLSVQSVDFPMYLHAGMEFRGVSIDITHTYGGRYAIDENTVELLSPTMIGGRTLSTRKNLQPYFGGTTEKDKKRWAELYATVEKIREEKIREEDRAKRREAVEALPSVVLPEETPVQAPASPYPFATPAPTVGINGYKWGYVVGSKRVRHLIDKDNHSLCGRVFRDPSKTEKSPEIKECCRNCSGVFMDQMFAGDLT